MTNIAPTYPTSRIATPRREQRFVIGPSFIAGRFDSHSVDCPFVFSVDGRKGMTYVGWDGVGYQSALSWHDDGGWTQGELILPRLPGDPVRSFNSALTSIVRDDDLWSRGELTRIDGWFYATFHAYPGAGYEAGPGVIGFLRSRDLITWEQVGAILDPADGGDWEGGGYYKSWLMHVDGVFYVFYNAKDVDEFGSVQVPPAWIEQTGMARSTDLVTWERHEGPVLSVGGPGSFDERFASDPCVLRDGDQWVMFYFGLSADGHAREGFATSTDLLHWNKSADLLLDRGSSGSIDATHAHKPAIITWDGQLEHYYCAVSPAAEPKEISGYLQTESRGIARATGSVPGDVAARR